ncbi:FAD:protein FMN transferase, partial [Zoogloea sp.]|uniref:FAD:protein FMN transferase n=1 Tax=Zoogloea sp. TaxID=49181 RepID=UPI0025FE38ED
MTPAVPARRAFIGAALGLAAGGAAAAGLQWHERSLVALGTTLQLRVAAGSAAQACVALDAAVAAVRRVETAMSLFRPDSELVRLNRAGRLDSPSADLRAVLQAALRVARRSG